MYFASGPTGAFDYHARARANKLEADLRALTKRVAELEAALKARDDADEFAALLTPWAQE